MTMVSKLRASLKEMELAPADQAMVELARYYSRAIDKDLDQLGRLGPKLHAALESLGMSPKARALFVKGGDDDEPESPLDELRARRRKRNAKTMDAATNQADT